MSEEKKAVVVEREREIIAKDGYWEIDRDHINLVHPLNSLISKETERITDDRGE